MKSVTLKSQIKAIKKALKRCDDNPFLYKDEELHYMKKSLRNFEEIYYKTLKQQQGGFGYE